MKYVRCHANFNADTDKATDANISPLQLSPELENVPAGHFEQSDASLFDDHPAAQGVHVRAPVAEYFPTLHANTRRI
jgi:hypothetical protein